MTTLKGTDRFTYSVNDNPTITYTNPDGENVTSLQACIQIDDGYGMFTAVEYRDIPKTGTHYTFSLTDNEREKLFGSVPREVYDGDINTTALVFRIRTVKDGINYFSSLNRNFVFSPWITASVVDENELTVALTGDPNVIVKYNSFAKAVMTAEARSGAAIDESLYIIRNGSQNGYSKEYTFLFPESDEFTFIASDSWEVPSSVTITQPMVDYIPLTQNIHYERPDATGKATIGCSGNWFNGSFGAVVNTLTAQCRYAISGDAFSDDWIDMSVTSNGNSYYATANIEIADFKQELSYIFEMRVTDKLDALQEQSDPVKSIPIFHWGENDFVFEVPVTFKNGTEGVDLGENPTIKGGLNVKGYLRLKSGDDNGDAVLFGDGADCYIMVSKDGEMFIKANKVDMSELPYQNTKKSN